MNSEKDLIEELEDRIDMEGVTIKSLIPFLILCDNWKEKNLEFILSNFNALAGDASWELLAENEKEIMYKYLVSRECAEDERWKDIGDYILVKNKKGVE